MILDNEIRYEFITINSRYFPSLRNQAIDVGIQGRGVSPGVSPRPSLNGCSMAEMQKTQLRVSPGVSPRPSLNVALSVRTPGE